MDIRKGGSNSVLDTSLSILQV